MSGNSAHSTPTAPSFPRFPFSRPTADTPPCEYSRIRGSAGVSRVTLWDGSTPWLLASHKAVRQVLANGDGSGRWSKDRSQLGFPELTSTITAKAAPTFVYLDNPKRLKDRQIIDRLFSSENIEKNCPGLIENIVDSLLLALKTHIASSEGPVDFYDVFAMRVPTWIIFSLLGAPPGDLDRLSKLNATQLRRSSTPTEVSDANKEILEYIEQLLKQRETQAVSRSDLIGDLVANEISSGHVDDHHAALRLLSPMLVTATITNLICYGLILLDRHPEQRADLEKNPNLAGNFVEELCRFHTSSAVVGVRVAMEDSYVGGTLIRAGEPVLLSNQSANRDQEIFSDPDIFNMHRKHANEALAFGYGPRRCPVEWLARNQLETVFRLLFTRLPDIKLAISAADIKWLPTTGVVGVSELHVCCNT